MIFTYDVEWYVSYDIFSVQLLILVCSSHPYCLAPVLLHNSRLALQHSGIVLDTNNSIEISRLKFQRHVSFCAYLINRIDLLISRQVAVPKFSRSSTSGSNLLYFSRSRLGTSVLKMSLKLSRMDAVFFVFIISTAFLIILDVSILFCLFSYVDNLVSVLVKRFLCSGAATHCVELALCELRYPSLSL